jgi:hypothetical protein
VRDDLKNRAEQRVLRIGSNQPDSAEGAVGYVLGLNQAIDLAHCGWHAREGLLGKLRNREVSVSRHEQARQNQTLNVASNQRREQPWLWFHKMKDNLHLMK